MNRQSRDTARVFWLGTALVFGLTGCGSPMESNRSLNSVRQPVLEQTIYSIDLQKSGADLPVSELQRLDAWFGAINLSYGDRLGIEGTNDARFIGNVEALARRHGAVPVRNIQKHADTDVVAAGIVRVNVSRSQASVPGCADWSARSSVSLSNATSPNFGCAINGNLAAMIADPHDLMDGAHADATTDTTTASKAVASYRNSKPSGEAGLNTLSSRGGDQ